MFENVKRNPSLDENMLASPCCQVKEERLPLKEKVEILSKTLDEVNELSARILSYLFGANPEFADLGSIDSHSDAITALQLQVVAIRHNLEKVVENL